MARIAIGVWRWDLKRRSRRGQAVPDADRLLWISPTDVEHALDIRRDPLFRAARPLRKLIGTVRKGDWDTVRVPLESTSVFDSVLKRYVEGQKWSQTPFYQEVERDVALGIPRFGCRSLADVTERFRALDRLYVSIEAEGYRTQHELRGGRPWKEILVAIDRNGRLLFVDGRHRLAMARALRVERIPAVVLARHDQWYGFAEEVRSVVAERGGRSPEPVPHPDLGDIPSVHGDNRFHALTRHLPAGRGRFLEIGPSWGYFSHRFEKLGYECWAVAHSENDMYFLQRLRDASGRTFRVVRGAHSEPRLPPDFDVVLALNIFDNGSQSERTIEALRRLLGITRPRCLVVQGPLKEEAEGTGAEAKGDGFVGFVSMKGFETVKEIGRGEDGRPLYLLAASHADGVPRGSIRRL